jgi:hypothetical protein
VDRQDGAARSDQWYDTSSVVDQIDLQAPAM